MFGVGLRCNGWVNSVIISVNKKMYYRCNYIYMHFFYILLQCQTMYVHNKWIIPNN